MTGRPHTGPGTISDPDLTFHFTFNKKIAVLIRKRVNES